MAVTAFFYAPFIKNLLEGEIGDLTAAVVRVALYKSDSSPDQDTDNDYADVDGTECSGTGYVAEGEALANDAVTQTLNVIKYDADDVVWSSSTITDARYAIMYVDTGTPATSELILYVDFGEDESSDSGDFTIAWNASGIFTITVADA